MSCKEILLKNFSSVLSKILSLLTIKETTPKRLRMRTCEWVRDKWEISKRKDTVFLYGFELYKNQGRNDMLPSFILYKSASLVTITTSQWNRISECHLIILKKSAQKSFVHWHQHITKLSSLNAPCKNTKPHSPVYIKYPI